MNGRLLDGMPYVHSSGTNVSARFRAAGWTPPETLATEAEQQARHDGALQAMKTIQAQSTNVSQIKPRKKS